MITPVDFTICPVESRPELLELPSVGGTDNYKMCVSEKDLVTMIPEVRSYSHIFYNVPSSVKELKEDYLPSKLWRMNNLYKVIAKKPDVGSDGLIVNFVMKYAQLVTYASLRLHPRVVILKSRQQGISTFVVIFLSDDMWTIPQLNCGIIAQDQLAGDGLKSKVSDAWRMMDENVKAFLNVNSIIDNNSEFGMSNGSGIMAKLSFRSGTLHRLLWTEVGKIANTDMNRITETKSGSLQTIIGTKDNIVALESTAEGDNDFKDTYELAEKMATKPITNKMYRPLFFSWITDGDCNSDTTVEVEERVASVIAVIEKDYSKYIATDGYKRQIGNFIYPDDWDFKLSWSQRNWLVGVLYEVNFDLELFYREYPHTPASAFYISNEALWYKDSLSLFKESSRMSFVKSDYEGISALYNPDYEVFAFMDLGSTDLWYVGYWQILDTGTYDKWGNEIWDYVLLDVDFASYEKVPYFSELMYDKPYVIDRLYLPHDGVHERVEGHSVETQFTEFGWDCDIIPKTGILTGIMNARRKMTRMSIDMVYASDGFECLNKYKRKYDKKLRKYTSEPVHDDASHGADMFRYAFQAPVCCARLSQASSLDESYSETSDDGFSV